MTEFLSKSDVIEQVKGLDIKKYISKQDEIP